MKHAKSVSENADPPDPLINRRQLRQQIPTSDMTIWRWQKDRKFPTHISINGRNYWRLSEVTAWLKQQADTSAPNDGGDRC
jgi:predicted DNA-binding transcriptional regulator AlpA